MVILCSALTVCIRHSFDLAPVTLNLDSHYLTLLCKQFIGLEELKLTHYKVLVLRLLLILR